MIRPTIRFLAAALFLSSTYAQEKSWSRLTNCKWMENLSNDGDSFHVQYHGKEFIFRLYFVDTCETSEQFPERVDEQAKFLRIPRNRVLPAGMAAEELTKKCISSGTFTVVTRWEDAMGSSRLPRNYAFILFGKNDESDLASTLIQNGLARIYGMPADPPGPTTADQFQSELHKLDASARQRRAGIYGNLENSSAVVAGSGISSDTVPGAAQQIYNSAIIILPANSHPPDVIDDPADDLLGEYAIQVVEGETIVQTGIPENNFSEIPGWNPHPSPTPDLAPTP